MRPLTWLSIPVLLATLVSAQTRPESRPASASTSRPVSQPASDAATKPPKNRPKPANGSKEALALARRVLDYAGGSDGLAKVKNLVFTFESGRTKRRLFWDRVARKVRVEYPEPTGGPRQRGVRLSVLVFDIAKDENVLRHPPRPHRLAPRVSAKGAFINDTYWLLVTLKVLDPGVSLSIDERQDQDLVGTKRLRLRFDKVGSTPRNEYVLHVESDTGQVLRWDFYRRAGQRPRSWEFKNYQRIGPLRLSLSRPQVGEARRKLDIALTDVRVNVKPPDKVWTSTELLFADRDDGR